MKYIKFYKRLLCMLLACTFFMLIALNQQVKAAPPIMGVEDGMVKFEITSTAASNAIRYRTVGWVVTREQVCSTTTPKQCADPRTKPHAVFLNQEVKQTGQSPNPAVPGKPLTSYYKIPEEVVTERLWKAGMEGIKDNDDLYFYAVMVSINGDGTVRKGPFYTLSGIKGAEGWRHPNDLDDYFGIHLFYRSADFPVDIIAKTVDGQVIQQPQVTFLKGNYKIGEEINHEFPEHIEDGGKTYSIVRSYLSPKQDKSQQKWLQENPETNDKVRIRSFTVALGGTDLIAEYHQQDGGKTEEPLPGSTKEAEVMEPAATATIQADKRGQEQFDVLQGIPTSESLYVQAEAKSYLYRSKFIEVKGSKTYPITISRTYTLRWTEEVESSPDSNGNTRTRKVSRSATETVTQSYDIDRKYSYWLINRLEVYGLEKATVLNYAMPAGQVVLQPKGYTLPNVAATHATETAAHLTDPVYHNVTLPGQTLQGGSNRPSVPSENWKPQAEAAIGKIKVKNDSLVFNGQTVMDSRQTEEAAPAPGSIPAPSMIEQNVLYGNGYVIDANKSNKVSQPSSGKLDYKLVKGIGGGQAQSFPIQGINPVTVHTPVVNLASVSDDKAHNQKTLPTAGRSAFILNRPFTVAIPTSGQHRSIKGYGSRDYAKYMRDKQVWFPFDVYRADRTTLIPKETWISIPVGDLQTTFYLPAWVDEANYTVLFRTIAENSPASFTSQMHANLDNAHHVATQTVDVEVIGRVYDFRITDISDYQWETVFRTAKGSATPTGNSYWVGLNGVDGAARGNTAPFVLPIRPGSHPETGKKNIAVKTGYQFKFEVKTLGNMFGTGDGIKITPTFYFVDSKGKNRQEVDLYYHSGNTRFIRIGSSADTERRQVTLDTRLRNISQQELTQTATSLWALNGSTGDRQTYIRQFLKNAQQNTYVGGYDVMLLPPQLRTLIGSTKAPSGVNAARVQASEQRWFGEYSLPAAPYVVPKGFNVAEYGRTNRLDDKSPIFLRNGYIIVNFKLETIRNQKLNEPHLQYKDAPLSNQWQIEGFKRSFVDPYGTAFSLLDGDVVFYHANLSSYDDFGTGGTH